MSFVSFHKILIHTSHLKTDINQMDLMTTFRVFLVLLAVQVFL